MSRLHEFVATTLADRQISDAEVSQIRQHLYADGELGLDDVKLLIELYCGTEEPSTTFSKLFFSVLEDVLLADGEISQSEQYYLLKMLYSDRVIRDTERDFLKKLRKKLSKRSPQFEELCQTALAAPNKNWTV
jgi:hypothetical protein